MKSAWKVCAIIFLATALVAQTAAPKPRKPKPAAATLTAADVQALKDAIASQQAALAQQQQQTAGAPRRTAPQGSGRAASANLCG